MHVEGDIGGYRRAIHQCIYQVVIVLDFYIAEFHRCCRIIKIHCYTIVRSAYCPDQAAGSDTRVEVMDLIRRGNLSLIEIQSYEAERSPVSFTIHPDIDALHKAHINVEDQGRSVAGLQVCGCSRPLHFSTTN